MTVKELLKQLQLLNKNAVVKDGFGRPANYIITEFHNKRNPEIYIGYSEAIEKLNK